MTRHLPTHSSFAGAGEACVLGGEESESPLLIESRLPLPLRSGCFFVVAVAGFLSLV